MGQNAAFRTRAWADGARLDEQLFPQVPMESEQHLSNPSRTSVTDIKGEELHSLGANRADPVGGVATSKLIAASCLNGDGNSLGSTFEGSRGLSDLRKVGGIPPPVISDAWGEPNPPAGRHYTSVLNQDVTHARGSLEGRPPATSQEPSQLGPEFYVPRLVYQIKDLERTVFVKEEEIATLQKQIQQFRELMNGWMSRAGQVEEVQETTRNLKSVVRKLHEDVNGMPSSRDDFLSIEIGKAGGSEFHCDKCALHEDEVLRSHTQLESARQEAVQLKEYILKLEAANSNLEQKVDKIQRQLCKEKTGQHGSYVDGQQTPFLWESTAKDMVFSITTFTGLLSKYTDSSGDNPARSLIFQSDFSGRGCIARDRHWKHLLKNFVCNRLFSGFEYERFSDSTNTVLFLGNEERARDCFGYFQQSKNPGTVGKANCPPKSELLDSLFFDYFQALHVLPCDVEALRAVFTSYDDLMGASRCHMVLQGATAAENQRCQRLVDSFITAAKMVWDFHKLCLSFESPATIFRVAPGEPFNADYMERIDAGDSENESFNTVPKVSFMTFPGFRLRKSIVKCQVFLVL